MGKLNKEQRRKANEMLVVIKQRDELESNIMRWIEEDPAEWVNRVNLILLKPGEDRSEEEQRALNSFVLFGVSTIINGFREEIVESWRDGRDPFDPSDI